MWKFCVCVLHQCHRTVLYAVVCAVVGVLCIFVQCVPVVMCEYLHVWCGVFFFVSGCLCVYGYVCCVSSVCVLIHLGGVPSVCLSWFVCVCWLCASVLCVHVWIYIYI